MNQGVSIIIPTYNGGETFSGCLQAILRQDYGGEIQLIVVDSGSTDGTVEKAEEAGAFVRRIDKGQFHHARTRNEALSFAEFNKVVYMVQDAIPVSERWLSYLAGSLDEEGVVAVYTNQIPHDDADPYARFETEAISAARGQKPVTQYIESREYFYEMPYEQAYRTIGLDNVCAIYRKESLIKTPFPEVDFAEDMAWALKSLLAGFKIRYAPHIKVRHSHNRSPEYRFRREIINSRSVAWIMKRVRDDLSFVKVRDLICLTGRIEDYVGGIKSDIVRGTGHLHYGDKREDTVLVVRSIEKRYPLWNKIEKIFTNILPGNCSYQEAEMDIVEQQARGHIQYVLGRIQENCRTREAETLQVVEQITASTLGRIYGEVYASRLLKGSLSTAHKRLVGDFAKGISQGPIDA